MQDPLHSDVFVNVFFTTVRGAKSYFSLLSVLLFSPENILSYISIITLIIMVLTSTTNVCSTHNKKMAAMKGKLKGSFAKTDNSVFIKR